MAERARYNSRQAIEARRKAAEERRRQAAEEARSTAFSISDARSELYMANPSFMVCFVVVRNVLPYPRFCKDYSAKENGLQSEFNYYNQFIILPVIYENFLIRIAKPDRLCYSKERLYLILHFVPGIR